MARTNYTILLIDDAGDTLEAQPAYQQYLDPNGYTAIRATSVAQALALWPQHQFDAVLLAHHLPEVDSLRLLGQLQDNCRPQVPTIVLLDPRDEAIAPQVKAAGAVDCLTTDQMTLDGLHHCLSSALSSQSGIPEASASKPLNRQAIEPEFFTASQIQVALSTGKIYIWRWHATSDRIVGDPNLTALLGIAPTTPITLNRFLDTVHPSDRRRVANTIKAAVAAGGDYASEYRLLTPSGEDCWVAARGQVTTGVTGGATSLSGVLIDITERKQAEQALSLRTQDLVQLNRSLEGITQELNCRNADLDQFATAVSHDLKAPLRGIRNLSQWLHDDLSPAAAPETRRQTELLLERIDWMEALINGLLAYARTGQSKRPLEPVNSSALVQDVIATLAPPADVDVALTGVFPVLRTRRLMLRQVLTNLISNAIEYGCPGGRGKITVSAESTGQSYEFGVSDRGPGVDPEYHNRIFDLFETLRARPSDGSTGVGLAIVKRLVEAEGGQLRVVSSVGQGMAVYFTWPAGAGQ